MELKIYDFNYYDNDLAAKRIESKFKSLLHDFEGMWLYREPEIKTEGDELPTYTIVSPLFGLIFVKAYIYDNDMLNNVTDKFWVINDRKVKSEFLRMRNYTHKIKARIDDPLTELERDISPKIIYVFPYLQDSKILSQVQLRSDETIYFGNIDDIKIEAFSENINDNDYAILISIIQNANIINRSSNIYIEEPPSDIAEAIELNNKRIARFDYDQMEASLTITEKSERIRGLAGSGKTVLLAMKAAKLHKRFPKKKIAFIFFTKSLYNQTTSLIRKYYNQIADDEPNWENLLVLHSWGGATTGLGFYSYVCQKHGIPTRKFDRYNSTFEYVCIDLLNNHSLEELFDYILVDEAQDFPLEFFLLVEKVAKKPKKIVIAYDELQTTNDIYIPQFDELFGSTNNKPNVTLEPQHDYILKKSYRNTLDALVTAFAFGFGFYHNITQIIQDKSTWSALGFEANGEFVSDNEITVVRPKENSPNTITDIYNEIAPINHVIKNDDNEVVLDVAEKILHFIKNENVSMTDILVIDIKMNKSKILNALQATLLQHDVESHIPGVVTDSRDFFKEGKVTLTTPRNAKGNEVPIVFVVGCEEIYIKNSITAQRQARNFMFISITRSKGWVYLYAAGRVKGVFNTELKEITKNIPSIKFIYPSEEKLNELAKIDFLTNNPKAKAIDDDLSKIKRLLSSGNKDMLRALLDLDPELKNGFKELVNDDEA